MSETTCRWNGSNEPRVLGGRHLEDCLDHDACRGCQPCTAEHCRVCGVEHGRCCAGCLDEARTNLAEVLRMHRALPLEVIHRGVEGEAMSLLGPSADPEAWNHRAGSILAGRIVPADCDAHELEDVRVWLDTQATHERHPLWVLGTWEMVWRDALDHETDEPVAVETAASYLGLQLTYMAGYDLVPFEDFARDLRRCVAHLEQVLHDGEQVERSRVTCNNPDCRKRPMLNKRAEGYQCPSCSRRYDDSGYRQAHADQLRHAGAQRYLPQRDAIATLLAQGRADRTVRKWLGPKDDPEDVVGGYCDVGTHVVWVWWPDLWLRHLTTKTRLRAVA